MLMHRYNELRDTIAERLQALAPAGTATRVAVLPPGFGAGAPNDASKIHYDTKAPAVEAFAEICATVMELGMQADKFIVPFDPTPLNAWVAPWSLTAHTDDQENMPLLMAVEEDDGSVSGVLMRDPSNMANVVAIARRFVEPEDAIALIDLARELGKDAQLFGCFKAHDIDAPSLQAAIDASPTSASGDLSLLVYRDRRWFCGSGSDASAMSAMSVRYGIPASVAEMATRPGPDVVRKRLLAGNPAALTMALAALTAPHPDGEPDAMHPANRILCDWWNASSAANESKASFFLVSYWDDASRTFHSAHGGMPAVLASDITEGAFFEVAEGVAIPTVITFCTHVAPAPDGSEELLASGQSIPESSFADLPSSDGGSFSLEGLRSLARQFKRAAAPKAIRIDPATLEMSVV